MRGVVRYGADPVVAILDSERSGELYEAIPIVGAVEDALAFEPTAALVGVATQGGRFPPAWRDLLKACIVRGLDLENGLHEYLADDAELVELAHRHGVTLRDLRKPPPGLNVPTGANLEVAARIVLTVGSDCAIGKMTVSLELDREARRRGLRSVFVPTGQTGIAIAGWGISVDAVVSDFVAGAAERLVVEGAERGGDLLWVEGQGALLHPAYSGVTLGLIHGSVPHAFVLCHLAGSTEIEGYPGHPLSTLPDLIAAARGRLASRSESVGRSDRVEHARLERRRGSARDRGDRRGDRRAGGRSRALRPGSAAGLGAGEASLTSNTCSYYWRTHVRTGGRDHRAPRPSPSPGARGARTGPDTAAVRRSQAGTRSGRSLPRTTAAIRARGLAAQNSNHLAGTAIPPGSGSCFR